MPTTSKMPKPATKPAVKASPARKTPAKKASPVDATASNLDALRAGLLSQNSGGLGILFAQIAEKQNARLREGLKEKGLPKDFRDHLKAKLARDEKALDTMKQRNAAPMEEAPQVAGLNTQDKALLIAASKGDNPAVEKALAKGASLKAKNAQNQTALGLAAIHAHEDTFDILWNAGARKLWTKDNKIRPEITVAAESSNDVAVKLMLRAGIDPNTKSASGDSTLVWAKDRKTRALLRKAGAI